MSTTDLKIQNRCDHRILGELVPLSPDRVSLYPKFHVGADATVEVFRYGIQLDPSRYTVHAVDSVLSPDLNKTSKILLTSIDKAVSPTYTINYSTVSETCPKCLGTLFTDDLDTAQNGDPKTVLDSGQLAQLVEKHIVTRMTSNGYHPWVGSRLHDLIGTKALDFNYIQTEIKLQVRSALEKLQEAQSAHRSSNPEVSANEALGSIVSINVTQDQTDPSIFYVDVVYKSMGGTQLEFEQALELSAFRIR